MNFHYIVAVVVICLAAATLLVDAVATQDELEVTALLRDFIADICTEMKARKLN